MLQILQAVFRKTLVEWQHHLHPHTRVFSVMTAPRVHRLLLATRQHKCEKHAQRLCTLTSAAWLRQCINRYIYMVGKQHMRQATEPAHLHSMTPQQTGTRQAGHHVAKAADLGDGRHLRCHVHHVQRPLVLCSVRITQTRSCTCKSCSWAVMLDMGSGPRTDLFKGLITALPCAHAELLMQHLAHCCTQGALTDGVSHRQLCLHFLCVMVAFPQSLTS